MTTNQAKLQHVVAIPYPAQGHITPMLQLCQQLVPYGFTFTFVNTHHIHSRVKAATANVDADSTELSGNTDQVAADNGSQQANGHHGHINNSHNCHGLSHALHIQEGKGDVGTVNYQLGNEAHARDEGKNVQIQAYQKQKGWSSIRMVFVGGGCAPEAHAHMSTSMEALMAAQNMKEEVEQVISDCLMEEQSVAFILTDILLGWSDGVASKFRLPWVCFWAASAATYGALIHFADLGEKGESVPVADEQGGEVPMLEGIPGLPPTCLHDLPKLWDDHTGKIVRHDVLKYFRAADKARFLLLNTFAELEGQVLQALSEHYSILAVGPLLPSRYISGEAVDGADSRCEGVATRGNLFREDRTCLDWLDKQAPSSVLFISFGSISARTDEQLEELAHAADASGCPFLWVRKPNVLGEFTHGCGLRGNGLIVSWAPQLDVLSHPAVGGFVTHCGWNSVMESLAMGVPMLCWADTGERMSNQRFVVQIWKCGLYMVSDDRRNSQHIDEAVLVSREEIEASIRCLMLEEAGALIRTRATHLRESAILAFCNPRSEFAHFVDAMQVMQNENDSEQRCIANNRFQ